MKRKITETTAYIRITLKGTIASGSQISPAFELISFLCDNVDNTSCCIITVKDTATSSPYYLNSLHPFKGDLSPINTAQINFIDPSTIHQSQCIRRSCLAKTAKINSKTPAISCYIIHLDANFCS